MISNLYFEYSPWWIAPILLGVAGAVAVFYLGGREFNKSQRWSLAALRFLTLFIVALLLLAPLLKISKRIDEKPLLLWLEDRSSSVTSLEDSAQVKAFYSQRLAEVSTALGEKYDVRKMSFDSELQAYEPGSFEGLQTDLAGALQGLEQQYYNQNVGGVVVVSDGIYNRGANPVYQAGNSPYPIYTVGVGDTSVKQDFFIEKLVHNELTYLNNQFPLEINLRGRKMNGRNFRVSVTNRSGTVLFSESGRAEGDNYFQKIETYLPAKEVGLQRYFVRLEAGEEEQTGNNSQAFSIEVIDNRKKIWITGSSPHPDMSAVAIALGKLDKYEVQSGLWGSFQNDEPADLYILFSPTTSMMEFVKNKPYWLIDGPASQPVVFEKFGGVRPGRGDLEQVSGSYQNGFSLFNLSENTRDFLRNLPPLQMPYGRIQPNGVVQPFLNKKIGQVETQEPLWFFRNDEQRSAVLLANGLWQWRIYDYRQNNSFQRFDELIAQTVQYLTARTEDQRFVVEADSRYNSGEPILMTARLYNPSLELDNSPEVEVTIRSDEGKEYRFNFSKTSTAYRLDAGNLPPANYTWTAKTRLGQDDFSRSGAFAVEEIRVEQADLVARHDVLRAIARESEGSFYKSTALESLQADLLGSSSAKSIQRLQTSISSLLNKKFLFFILLILLAAEWGLRKYFGKY